MWMIITLVHFGVHRAFTLKTSSSREEIKESDLSENVSNLFWYCTLRTQKDNYINPF